MPLAICFLLSLTLLDQLSPIFLKPELSASLRSQIGEETTLIGVIDEPVQMRPTGIQTVVTLDHGEKISLWLDPALADIPLNPGTKIQFRTKLRRPTHYQNPGGFDYRRFLERRGILLAGSVKPNDLEVLDEQKHWLRQISKIREKIHQSIRKNADTDEAAFLMALLTGDTTSLSPALRDDFTRTGTSHLVAISGQHIGMIGIVILTLLLSILKRSQNLALRLSVRRLALVMTVPIIFYYTLLAGLPPSAVRAWFLWVLLVVAPFYRREMDPLSALAFAGIGIGLIDPAAIFSASFQLSFLAVLGIIFVIPHEWLEDASWTTRYLKRPFLISLGATLATAPWVAYRFHTVSLSSVLVNLWAVPAVSFLLILAGASTGLAILFPPLGDPCLQVSALLARGILSLLHRSAGFSEKYQLVFSSYPTEWEILLLYLMVGGIFWLWNSPKEQWIRKGAFVGLTVGLMISGTIAWRSFNRELQITFLDVGQGDAALVVTPSGKSLLVDAGGFLIPGEAVRRNPFEVGRDVIVPYLKRLGLKRIDAILLSHPHPDHFGGLQAVLENFEVGEFWWNGQTFPDDTFAFLLEAVSRRAATEKILKDGDHWKWRECEIEVIYPERIDLTRNINDNSLVVRLTYGNTRILFPGDIEKEGEKELADHRDIQADILKIPHHASRTSSSIAFIDSVQPRIAVASLGDGNMFGFPHPGVLEKYERRGVKVFRTDRDGAVIMKIPRDFPRRSIKIER